MLIARKKRKVVRKEPQRFAKLIMKSLRFSLRDFLSELRVKLYHPYLISSIVALVAIVPKTT